MDETNNAPVDTDDLQRPTTAASVDITIVDDDVAPSSSSATNSSAPTNAEIAQAEDEWAAVEKIQGERSVQKTTTKELVISYEDAETYLLNLDLAEQKKHIQPKEERKGFAALLHSLFGTHLKSKALSDERDTIFALAQVAFNNSDDVHIRMLQTIYLSLTGIDLCPRFGPHWESIGFQGEDPSTDLRGLGMFGLLQLQYFVKKQHELALRVHKLSRDERQNFPFSVTSINLSRLVLQSLRTGALNAASKRHNSVLKAAHELHTALYYKLYIEWKKGNKTIIDFPPLLQQLTRESTDAPQKLVAFYHKAMEQAAARNKPDDDFVDL